MKNRILFLILFISIGARLNSQEIIWTKKISDQFFSIKEMKMDSFGNFYLLGNFNKDKNYLPFIAKLNPQAELLWLKNFQSTDSKKIQCNTIELDKNESVHIAGYFSDTITIDTNMFISQGIRNGFIAKFDVNGNVNSFQIIGKKGNSAITDIAFDASNFMYITGSFIDTLIIDSIKYISNISTTFLAKYNGNMEWLKYSKAQYGCCNESIGRHIAVNNNGDIFLHITGYGHLLFDSTDIYFACDGQAEAVAIFDNTGHIKVLKQIGCHNPIKDVISYSNYFITAEGYGYKTSAAEAFRYDAVGNAVRMNRFGINSDGKSITLDMEGSNFLMGNHNYPYSNDTTKIFINKNNTDVSKRWEMYIKASQYAEGISIIYKNDYIYVLGKFAKLLLTADSLNTESESYFIAKIKDNQVLSLIDNTEIINGLQIYPNPSNNQVVLQLDKSIKEFNLCVYDVLGNCIYDQQIKNSSSHQIDLSNKAKGIYFIEVTIGEEKISRKIILN